MSDDVPGGPDLADEAQALAQQLRKYLAWQESDGLKQLVRSPDMPRLVSAPAVAAPANRTSVPPISERASAPKVYARDPAPKPAGTVPATARTSPGQAGMFAEAPTPESSAAVLEGAADKTLDQIRQELGDCKRCKLCNGRTQIVFGSGNPKAELMFVGEGPGADEDAQGVPFVGKAGQLLTKMIEAMKFSRDEVYICNVVKCRPPNNRNPEPDEIAACEPFLKAQVASVKPKAIVCLGKFATQTLLRTDAPISRLRGQWKQYQGIPLMPTFHPAYLLRSPPEKKLAWLDLQEVMKKFGKLP